MMSIKIYKYKDPDPHHPEIFFRSALHQNHQFPFSVCVGAIFGASVRKITDAKQKQ
jgi:hypothetical protein